MKRLLMWTACLVLFLSLLTFGASVLGSRFAPVPTEAIELLGFEQYSSGQACWHDVCPDRTTIEQAQITLHRFPDEVRDIKLYKDLELDWTVATDPLSKVSGFWYDYANPTLPISALQAMYFQSAGSLTVGDAINLFGTPIS